MNYAVSCLTDDGVRVRTTRKDFPDFDSAEHYAKGVAESRHPAGPHALRILRQRMEPIGNSN